MQWWGWVIIGIVAFAVLAVIMHQINRHFIVKYDMNLYGGALLMLIAAAGIGGGAFLFIGGEQKVIGLALIAVGAIALIVTLIYDFKKCGGVGIGALLLQLVFCVPALIVLLDLVFNKGRGTVFSASNMRRSRREARRDRERRAYYDDRYDRY